jgi:hypothetical protein
MMKQSNAEKLLTRNRQFALRIETTDKSVPFAFKGIEYRIEDSEISGTKRIVYGTKPLDITIPKF